VEFSTFHFSDALISYGLALKLQPNDPSILEAIMKTSQERQKDRKGTVQYFSLVKKTNILIVDISSSSLVRIITVYRVTH